MLCIYMYIMVLYFILLRIYKGVYNMFITFINFLYSVSVYLFHNRITITANGILYHNMLHFISVVKYIEVHCIQCTSRVCNVVLASQKERNKGLSLINKP